MEILSSNEKSDRSQPLGLGRRQVDVSMPRFHDALNTVAGVSSPLWMLEPSFQALIEERF